METKNNFHKEFIKFISGQTSKGTPLIPLCISLFRIAGSFLLLKIGLEEFNKVVEKIKQSSLH